MKILPHFSLLPGLLSHYASHHCNHPNMYVWFQLAPPNTQPTGPAPWCLGSRDVCSQPLTSSSKLNILFLHRWVPSENLQMPAPTLVLERSLVWVMGSFLLKWWTLWKETWQRWSAGIIVLLLHVKRPIHHAAVWMCNVDEEGARCVLEYHIQLHVSSAERPPNQFSAFSTPWFNCYWNVLEFILFIFCSLW